MKHAPTPVDRLVRLNRFNQERAETGLRQAGAELVRAEETHRSAESVLHGLADWKSRSDERKGLDLSMYVAVLHAEDLAMTRCEQALLGVDTSQDAVDSAKDGLQIAVSSSRVSERRQHRKRSEAEIAAEKQLFDQIADVWLNFRGARHD